MLHAGVCQGRLSTAVCVVEHSYIYGVKPYQGPVSRPRSYQCGYCQGASRSNNHKHIHTVLSAPDCSLTNHLTHKHQPKTHHLRLLPVFDPALLACAEGISYLGVYGLVAWSLYTKATTGSGLPAGPSGLLGALEGFSFLTVLACKQRQHNQGGAREGCLVTSRAVGHGREGCGQRAVFTAQNMSQCATAWFSTVLIHPTG